MGFATTLLTGQQIWTLFVYPGKKIHEMAVHYC